MTDGVSVANSILHFKGKTFDEKFLNSSFQPVMELPFKELKWVEDRSLTLTPRYEGSYPEFLTDLIKAFEAALMTVKPDEEYICLHSSGLDSRIVSGVMLRLKKKGFSDFSNVHFLHIGHSEAKSFLELMEIGGWTKWKVVDDSIPDILDIGNPDTCTEGWNSYTTQTKLHDDFNPKETILMGGAMGEVLQFPFDRWYLGNTWFSSRGSVLNRAVNTFKDVLFPMLHPEVMALAVSMPKEWRTPGRDNRDKVRTDLVEMLGMAGPAVLHQNIGYHVSVSRKNDMVKRFTESMFFKRFGMTAELFPSEYKDKIYGFGPRMWGFAVTVYERVGNA